MTCVGNTTLAYACLRLALASGWTWAVGKADAARALESLSAATRQGEGQSAPGGAAAPATPTTSASTAAVSAATSEGVGASALIGWEDLGEAWARDSECARRRPSEPSASTLRLVPLTPPSSFLLSVSARPPITS